MLKIMVRSVEHSSNTFEFSFFLAQSLMRFGDVRGFIFLFDHLLTGKLLPEQRDIFNTLDAVAFVGYQQVLPFIRLFLQHHYENAKPVNESRNSAYDLMIETAGVVAKQSPQALEVVLYTLQIIAWMYKDAHPNAAYLFSRIAQIETNYYVSHDDHVDLDEVAQWIGSSLQAILHR